MLLEAVAALPIPKPTSPGICHLIKKALWDTDIIIYRETSLGQCASQLNNAWGHLNVRFYIGKISEVPAIALTDLWLNPGLSSCEVLSRCAGMKMMLHLCLTRLMKTEYLSASLQKRQCFTASMCAFEDTQHAVQPHSRESITSIKVEEVNMHGQSYAELKANMRL